MSWKLKSEEQYRAEESQIGMEPQSMGIQAINRYGMTQRRAIQAEADLCRALDALQKELEAWKQIYFKSISQEVAEIAGNRIATLTTFIEPFKKK